ncbi:MAG: patatin-like phospholipase family protein [Nitrospinaceae bacterium]
MKTRKIALIIAGGVSLGSYESGVLTEFLYALDTLNKESDSERFELDVITGASAGSLTAALVARIVMYDLPGRAHHLYRAWVEDINVDRLMRGAPENSLFSKDIINKIAEDYLTGEPFGPTAPASFAPENLRLSFTLSNMNGIDYAVPYHIPPSAPGFVSTFFSDYARFAMDAKNLPGYTEWKSISRAAVASGNFPVAFRPHEVLRVRENYPGSVQSGQPDYFPRELAFLDGGLFNNEPLREAMQLASAQDGGYLDKDRLFILIDPNINRSFHEEDVTSSFPFRDYLLRLLVMVYGESNARDWIRASRWNNQIQWRDDLVKNLFELINDCTLEHPGQIVERLDSMAEQIIDVKRRRFPNRYSGTYLDDSREKIVRRFSEPYGKLGGGAGGSTDKQEIFWRMVFILNNAAGVQNKSQTRLGLIGAHANETAGDQMFGFAGFFDEKWRIHDYRRGRIKAHEILKVILQVDYDRETDSGGKELEDYIIPQSWNNFPNVEIKDANRDLRERFRDLAVDRVMGLLRDNLPWWTRWPIKKFFVEKKVGEFLKL